MTQRLAYVLIARGSRFMIEARDADDVAAPWHVVEDYGDDFIRAQDALFRLTEGAMDTDPWDDENDASDSRGPSSNGWMFIGIIAAVAVVIACLMTVFV